MAVPPETHDSHGRTDEEGHDLMMGLSAVGINRRWPGASRPWRIGSPEPRITMMRGAPTGWRAALAATTLIPAPKDTPSR